jgi:rhamnosyltransferase subunit B
MSTDRTILLPTFGSAGDVNPFLVLGRELQGRGNRVIVITNPHFEQTVVESGLAFMGVGSEQDYLDVIENPDLWHPTRSFYVMAENAILRIMRDVYELLIDFDPATTTIAAPGIIFGARLAHETHGFPYATVQLQPSVTRSAYDTPVQGSMAFPGWTPPAFKRAWFGLIDRMVIDKTLGPPVKAYRAELGLAPAQTFFGDYIHSPQCSIGLYPDWFAPPQPDWPPQLQLTGFIHAIDETAGLPDDLVTFLDAGPAPVVFTPGSAMKLGEQFFTAAVDACRRLDCRGVLVTPFVEQTPTELPENVHRVRYAPFDLLLPRAAALVYHGGIGTMAQTLAAGIPHLVMPLGHDQPDNARRLQRLGVGDALPPSRFTGDRVARKLEPLLTSSTVRARCDELAVRVDFQRALTETCDLIEGCAQSLEANGR